MKKPIYFPCASVSLLGLLLAFLGLPLGSQAQTYPKAESLLIGLADTTYAVPTTGSVYYVAPEERADYPGTAALGSNAPGASGTTMNTPWTLKRAVDNAPAGATLVLRGGTYRTGNLRLERKLTIQPYSNEKVWVKGSVRIQTTEWAKVGNLWVKNNWTYKFRRPSNTPGVGDKHIDWENHPEADLLDQVFFNGQPLEQKLTKGAVTDTKHFYVDTVAQKLYLYRDPTVAGTTVEATAYGLGFFVGKGAGYNGSGSVVQGIGVAHFAVAGFNIQTTSVKVRHCAVVWNGFAGFGLYNNSNNLLIDGNRISYNGSNGVTGSLTSFSTFARNYISDNNFYQFNRSWNAAGLKLSGSQGLVYRDNVVENNNAIGLWMDESCYDATIVRNVCKANQGGIVFELCHKAVIAGNVVVGPSSGILVEDATAAKVYNNTLVNCNKGIFIGDGTRGDVGYQNTLPAKDRKLPSQEALANGVTWETSNTVIKNNLIINSNFASVQVGAFIVQGGQNFCARYAAKPSGPMVQAMNHNVYYRSPDNTPPPLIRWATKTSGDCQLTYPSLVAFRAGANFDQQGKEVASAPSGDASFFVDLAAGNYQLSATSPARGAGEALDPDVRAALNAGLPAAQQWPTGTVDAGAYRAAAPPKTAQTITFVTDFANRVAGQTLSLAATSTGAPNLPITYSLVNTPATVATLSGNTLTLVGVGSATVRASKAGNAAFLPATADATFAVGQGTPVLDFAALADQNYTPGATLTLQATSSVPSLPIVYSLVNTPASVATLSGNALTLRGVGLVTVRATQPGNANYLAATPVERSFVARGVALALNAGGQAYTFGGLTYAPDASYATGGTPLDRPTRAIAGTEADRLYQTERWGNFSYALPLQAGTYEVTFNFAELYYETNGAGQRVFDVLAEGAVALSNLDLFTLAGGANKAYNRTISVVVTDGTLDLQFRAEPGKNNAQVCGLVVRRVSAEAPSGNASRGAAGQSVAASAPLAVPPVTPHSSNESASLSAFPNPSPDGRATLAVTAAVAQTAQVYVHDAQGHLVGLFTVPLRAGQTEFRLPGTLGTGTFHVQATIDRVPQRFKLKVD